MLFGCAACQLMTPKVKLEIELNIDQKHLNNMHILWDFSDAFTAEILTQYDKNRNHKLDKEELKKIQRSLLDYLAPKNMLTKISYAQDENADSNLEIEPKYKNFTLKMISNQLLFTYDADMDIAIEDKSVLSLSFKDDEAFFDFVVTKLNINKNKIHYQENLYLFTAFIQFANTPFKEASKQTQTRGKSSKTKLVSDENTTKVQESNLLEEEPLHENILKKTIIKLKSLFESIKDEKNPLSYIALLLFAYLYGVIHALGPGHGKTLVASYFLSNDRSYSKALFISLAIGIVHTFSAFLLTIIIYFTVNSLLAKFLNDTIFYTTKISALIIIGIAGYLLYKKYKAYKKINRVKKAPMHTFSVTPHVATCSCHACKVDKNSTDTALILSAGIIPCPGTITIFIFSFSLGMYYAGFLSALVMSLGMSTIIFFSAILSVVLRKKTVDTNSNLKKYLEYGSLFIILTLGLILLFA